MNLLVITLQSIQHFLVKSSSIEGLRLFFGDGEREGCQGGRLLMVFGRPGCGGLRAKAGSVN